MSPSGDERGAYRGTKGGLLSILCPSPPILLTNIDVLSFPFCRFQETKPLILFTNSIDFVRQFHWICLAIPLILFANIVGLLAGKRQSWTQNLAKCHLKIKQRDGSSYYPPLMQLAVKAYVFVFMDFQKRSVPPPPFIFSRFCLDFVSISIKPLSS